MSDNANDEELKDLPGPWGFPVVGSLLSLVNFKEKTFMKWAEEDYGPVYEVKLGPTKAVVIQGFEAFQEAFVEKADAYSGRIEAKILTAGRDNKGLFFKQYDELWTKWRAHTRDSFKAIWQTIENGLVEESGHFQDALSKLEGENDILQLVTMTMANGIMQTCFSRRYDVTDKSLADLVVMCYADIRNPKFTALFLVPWMAHIPSYSRFIASADENRKNIIKVLLTMAEERMKENRSTEDFVTSFSKAFPNATVQEREYLAVLMEDFVFAGTSTTASAYLWVVLFMVKNPEIMKRMQQELDSVLGDCEDPVRSAISCKTGELNFTRAVLEESFRMRCIAPTSLFHTTTKDTSVMGFRVPEGHAVVPNIWSVHYDKQYWAPDPETFRPERHLDTSGVFKKSDHVIPFSMGWRSCVGKRIAETEVLAHTVAMFHKYDVTIAPSDADIDMAGTSLSILSPLPFKLKFAPRK